MEIADGFDRALADVACPVTAGALDDDGDLV